MGLPHFCYYFTAGSIQKFFWVHQDSKRFSNEIIKQQHCLLTTANIWSFYLLSRFYGKSYSCQWRTTQNKYPKAAEQEETREKKSQFILPMSYLKAKCFHFPLWVASKWNLEMLFIVILFSAFTTKLVWQNCYNYLTFCGKLLQRNFRAVLK